MVSLWLRPSKLEQKVIKEKCFWSCKNSRRSWVGDVLLLPKSGWPEALKQAAIIYECVGLTTHVDRAMQRRQTTTSDALKRDIMRKRRCPKLPAPRVRCMHAHGDRSFAEPRYRVSDVTSEFRRLLLQRNSCNSIPKRSFDARARCRGRTRYQLWDREQFPTVFRIWGWSKVYPRLAGWREGCCRRCAFQWVTKTGYFRSRPTGTANSDADWCSTQRSPRFLSCEKEEGRRHAKKRGLKVEGIGDRGSGTGGTACKFDLWPNRGSVFRLSHAYIAYSWFMYSVRETRRMAVLDRDNHHTVGFLSQKPQLVNVLRSVHGD